MGKDDLKDRIYEIDLDGHVLCQVRVKQDGLSIDGAINGHGESILLDKITIKELTIKETK